MSYTIRRADLKTDRQEILSLWERNNLHIPGQKFSWMYEHNPHGPARCWLACDTISGSAIGAAALFPKRLLVGGRSCLAGIAGDFVVDKKHRLLGVALAIQKAALSAHRQDSFDFLYSLPNAQSERVLERAGYRNIGGVVWMTKPMRSFSLLQQSGRIPLGARVWTRPLDLLLRLASKETYSRERGSYSLEVLSEADERFDEFCADTRGRYAIFAERDRRHLNWRFAACPFKRYTLFALVDTLSRKIAGYIASYISQGRVYIADLLASDTGNSLACLLSEFLLWQRKQGATAVSIIFCGAPGLVGTLKRYGFMLRRQNAKMQVFAEPDSALLPSLLDQTEWLLFEGDSDL